MQAAWGAWKKIPLADSGTGGWVAGYFDGFLGKVMVKQISRTFDLLLGRKTYEIFAAHWPYVNT